MEGWRDANKERDGEDEGCVHMLHVCVCVCMCMCVCLCACVCVCVYVVCVVCSLFHDQPNYPKGWVKFQHKGRSFQRCRFDSRPGRRLRP